MIYHFWMNISFSSRRSGGVLFFVVALVTFAASSSISAAPSTTVTWKVSSLAAGESKNLSAMVSTNSPGVKTWSKTGTCTLTPTKKPTKLTMGSKGSCVVTLKIAKSKSYPAKSSRKTLTLAAPTATPMTSTTVKPITTTTPTTAAPSASAATVRSSGSYYGYEFTPSSVNISVGQSVAFIVSSFHNVKWQDGDPGRGFTDAAYSRKFSSSGVYSFICERHPEMTGTITVG